MNKDSKQIPGVLQHLEVKEIKEDHLKADGKKLPEMQEEM